MAFSREPDKLVACASRTGIGILVCELVDCVFHISEEKEVSLFEFPTRIFILVKDMRDCPLFELVVECVRVRGVLLDPLRCGDPLLFGVKVSQVVRPVRHLDASGGERHGRRMLGLHRMSHFAREGCVVCQLSHDLCDLHPELVLQLRRCDWGVLDSVMQERGRERVGVGDARAFKECADAAWMDDIWDLVVVPRMARMGTRSERVGASECEDGS
jgi:hypothetical protein